MRTFSFFLKIFLILWVPIAPFGLYFGPSFFLFWSFTSTVVAAILARNTVGVLQDFIRYVDSGHAKERPGQMNVRKSILYGPLIRRFREIQDTLGLEMAKTKKEQALLNTVLATISDGVMAIDRERNILFVNQAARQLCEIKKDSVNGKSIEEVIPVSVIQEASRSRDFFDRPMKKEFSVFYDDQEKQLSMQSEPFGTGDTSGVVFTIRDLSDVYQQEKERKDFVMNASHELRTPLMAIRGYLDPILEGDMPLETQERFLKKISENVDRLTQMSTNLLELSKNDIDQHSPSDSITNIKNVVVECLENYRTLILAKGLHLVVAEKLSDIAVHGDHPRLKTILENLLDNAIKYSSPPGRIEVVLGQDARYCVLQVKDTGIGIAKDHQKKIFDRFFRVDEERTTEGTGLGLSIVKTAVEQLKGTVNVESAVNQGSTFTIRLPKR